MYAGKHITKLKAYTERLDQFHVEHELISHTEDQFHFDNQLMKWHVEFYGLLVWREREREREREGEREREMNGWMEGGNKRQYSNKLVVLLQESIQYDFNTVWSKASIFDTAFVVLYIVSLNYFTL